MKHGGFLRILTEILWIKMRGLINVQIQRLIGILSPCIRHWGMGLNSFGLETSDWYVELTNGVPTGYEEAPSGLSWGRQWAEEAIRKRGTVGINDPFWLHLQSLSDGSQGTAILGRHTVLTLGFPSPFPPSLKKEQKNFEGLGHGLQ